MGALPVGPLEEDGWEAAGWKANLVRSMVGAEVPLDEVGAEVPLDEVKEAGRRLAERPPPSPPPLTPMQQMMKEATNRTCLELALNNATVLKADQSVLDDLKVMIHDSPVIVPSFP